MAEIEVPNGKVLLMGIFVDPENEQLAIDAYASRKPIEYVLGEDGKPTEVEVLTDIERAREIATGDVNRFINKYIKRQAGSNATTIPNLVS